MIRWTDHILIVPILLPLIAGAAMLLIKESNRKLKAAISLGTTILLTAAAVALMYLTDTSPEAMVYRLGNWPAPFGIVLVADRLSAVMVLLTALLALTTLVFSLTLASWRLSLPLHVPVSGDGIERCLPYRRSLQSVRILRISARGILRTCPPWVRRRSESGPGSTTLQINLAASLLFLIGVSLIYSCDRHAQHGRPRRSHLRNCRPRTARYSRQAPPLLGIVFLVKAGIWPLSFWLPTTYSAAVPPVAAMFSIMSKVGIYVILRLMDVAVR